MTTNNQCALDVNKWMKMAEEKFALTILDIMSLKPGEKLKVLTLDRNVLDIAEDLNDTNVPKFPMDFFRGNCCVYTHSMDPRGGLKGTMYWDAVGERGFEFELKLPKCWYPLTNGYIPKTDPQGCSKFKFQTPQHWTMFPLNTLVGWRGPMIPWSKLSDLPKVYYSDV